MPVIIAVLLGNIVRKRHLYSITGQIIASLLISAVESCDRLVIKNDLSVTYSSVFLITRRIFLHYHPIRTRQGQTHQLHMVKWARVVLHQLGDQSQFYQMALMIVFQVQTV